MHVRTYLKDRKPDSRYASFDYCFNYFQSFHKRGATKALANKTNLEISCLQLGFYLASWGMYRGSAKLLKHNCKKLAPVISFISTTDPAIWEIDLDSYTPSNIEKLLSVQRSLSSVNGGGSDTLITKMMLGVYGNTPAFDTQFKRGLEVSTCGRKALTVIGQFYDKHRDEIERLRTPTLDFLDGTKTSVMYTRAKIVDMAFFIKGSI